MKKHIINVIALILVLTVISFICFAFVLNQINPFLWDMSYRGGFVVSFVCLVLILPTIYGAVKDLY